MHKTQVNPKFIQKALTEFLDVRHYAGTLHSILQWFPEWVQVYLFL